jgi:transposase
MTTFTNAVGTDVSKATLDVYDYLHGISLQVANNKMGYKHLLKWLKQHHVTLEEVVICFEHTGIYSLPLAVFLSEHKISFCIVSGLEIKRSLGINRGKSDKKDAKAIARYAYLRRGELKLYHLPSRQLLELKSLLSLREKMIKDRKGYQNTLGEMQTMLKVGKKDFLYLAQAHLIKELTNQIKKVEKQMKELIEQDEQLAKMYRLITSVKGVGLILGVNFLVYTGGFTLFDDWRKFACYSGIAPFEYQSGSSIKSKKKISHLANKNLKALLSNAACCCIQSSNELKQYYQKRLSEGKSKMSTQNIIRNKIVARVFAVIKRGTPFVEDYKKVA